MWPPRTRGDQESRERTRIGDAIDRLDEPGRHVDARIEQHAAINGKAAPPVGEVASGSIAAPRGALIEPGERRDQPVEVRFEAVRAIA